MVPFNKQIIKLENKKISTTNGKGPCLLKRNTPNIERDKKTGFRKCLQYIFISCKFH